MRALQERRQRCWSGRSILESCNAASRRTAVPRRSLANICWLNESQTLCRVKWEECVNAPFPLALDIGICMAYDWVSAW